MNKGFSSVYLMLIMSSICLLLLVVCELCCGHAAGSICENVCAVAGESVLSEYQKDVQRRYGLLLLNGSESRLERMCSYYISRNLAGSGILVRPRLKECFVSAEAYAALDTSNIARQVNILGTEMLGKALLDEAGITGAVKALFEPEAQSAEDAADSLSSEGAQSQQEDGSRRLKDMYESAMDTEFETGEGRDLESVDRSMLPTAILGVDPSKCLVLSAASAMISGGVSPSGAAQAWYISQLCSDMADMREDTVLRLEGEYVLFGRDSDRENGKAAKRALFELRMAVNLVKNLADSSKMAAYAAEAAAFPGVPAPAAVLILAAIDAATEAKAQAELIAAGGCVPIAGALAAGPGGRSFGYYGDYLMLMLLLLPEDTRMARLMDIVQMNASCADGADFSFMDYCCGFSLRAVFDKESIVSIVPGEGMRHGSVVQEHGYR